MDVHWTLAHHLGKNKLGGGHGRSRQLPAIPIEFGRSVLSANYLKDGGDEPLS